jgi:EAL domain-containing protein (putative c-di-GMP-specific phosphodiesterase class I)
MSAARTYPIDNPHYAPAKSSVERALRTVRAHLNMDVAFISEFVGNSRYFHHVDSKSGRAPVKAGDWISLADGYCKKIVDGELPQLIPNTADVAAAIAIPATRNMPIGSHISVPLRLSDGQLYGTFCCFSFDAVAGLNERDLQMMKAFAELVAQQIDSEMTGLRERAIIFERIDAVLKSNQPSMVYQPSYCISDQRLLGAESLARFGFLPHRSPDVWFAEARQVNLQVDLELKAIRSAVQEFAPAWRFGPLSLSLNSSAQTILDPRLGDMLRQFPAEQIILEITEHDHVENYETLMSALAPLRARGVKIAVDDAGSGYASMRHILNIRPDIIKLDVSLTNGIDTDLTRLALARALCEFGRQTGCNLVAEGIETAGQLETLRGIGVHAAQGYFMGRPMPFDQFRALVLPCANIF